MPKTYSPTSGIPLEVNDPMPWITTTRLPLTIECKRCGSAYMFGALYFKPMMSLEFWSLVCREYVRQHCGCVETREFP